MELLDRYLQAVAKHLPWQRQQDIIAELRANLESQLDEKQSELSRSLTQAEAEAWLQQLGSPVQMASQYQPQQCLIGPAIFPVYLYVLRLVSMWAIIIYVIVSTVTIVLGSPGTQSIAIAALRLPSVLIQLAAWVTLIFAAVEFTAARYPEKCPSIAGFHAKWTPRDLPPLEKAPPPQSRRRFAYAVAEVIFGFLFLVWLLLFPHYPILIFGPGLKYMLASPFTFAPIWITVYWWAVALSVVQLTWQWINLLRGAWRQPDRPQQIVFKVFSLIPIGLLVNAPGHLYLLLKNPAADLPRYGQALDSINRVLHFAILIVCVIVALQLAWEIVQWIVSLWRRRASAVAPR